MKILISIIIGAVITLMAILVSLTMVWLVSGYPEEFVIGSMIVLMIGYFSYTAYKKLP